MNHPPHHDPNSMIGRRLLDRYLIVRELARGGMGVVYLARAEGAGDFATPVVVKLILRELAQDERYLQMFAREAKIVSTLRDPSIVKVLAFDEENGDYIMVLEYVRGYHLGQWKKYLRKLGREVPTDIMLQLAIDILGALHHAHIARHADGELMHIVHRDVSPSNVLLDSSDGRGRLLDFGVARMRGGTSSYKTQVKSVMGKLPYLAPELLGGAEATAQSDLYAMAVVVHETLYGRNVFRGETDAATMFNVMNHAPQSVAQKRDDIPPGLDEVLARALAKSPSERYETAAEFQRALRKLQPTPEHEVREALARLLEQDFGEDMAKALGIESLAKRDEAWRRLSLLPNGAEARARDTMGLSRRTGSQANVPIPHGMTSGSLPMSRSGHYTTLDTNPQLQEMLNYALGQRRTSPVVIVSSVVALLVAVGAAVMIWQDSGSRAPVVAPPIQVIQTPLAPASGEGKGPVKSAASAAPDGVEAAEDEASQDAKPRAVSRAKPRRQAAPARKGPDAAALTAAFRRKQGGVQRCFSSHPDETAKVQARIEVEFSIDAQGNLSRARILPATVGSSPLGECLADVAKGTHFPAQGKALVFAIPVTARAVR